MAGRGGLNLTHGEAMERFRHRYGAATDRVSGWLVTFSPSDLIAWCAGLGIDTFTGSSGRVFPVGLKASPLLRGWLRRLDRDGVRLALRHRWQGWGDAPGHGAQTLRFETPDGPVEATADAVVLAMGGASWPRLGSDGGWTHTLAAASVPVVPIAPANVGLIAAWPGPPPTGFAGTPLKSVGLRLAGPAGEVGPPVQGEAMLTAQGIEGQAVYALGPAPRRALAVASAERTGGAATLLIDLRPQLTVDALAAKLARQSPRKSLSQRLRSAGAPPVWRALLTAAGEVPTTPAGLAARLKALPMPIAALAGLDRAISSAGGLCLTAVADDLAVAGLPGVFAAGEMLDWEAPTGGYLLQACFASGRIAGEAAAAYAFSRRSRAQT